MTMYIKILFSVLEDVEFSSHGDRRSEIKISFTKYLPRRIAEIEKRNVHRQVSDDLKGEGLRIKIPSNIIVIYTRLEVLLGLKLFGDTNTLTEASILFDELYKRGGIPTEEQYRNALDKIHTN